MPRDKKPTEAETFFIKNHLDLPAADVAKKLGRTERFVQKQSEKFLGTISESITTQPVPNIIPELSPVTGKPKLESASEVSTRFARREGITIMTEAASQAADETRHLNSPTMSPKLQKSVFKIKPDKKIS